MAEVRITDGAALDRELSGLAEAIRQKGGTTAQLRFPGGSFQQAVEQLPTGGDCLFDAGLEGNLEGEVVTQARKLRQYAISSNALVSLRAPRVTDVGTKAFYRCSHLANVELPAALVLRHLAIYGGPSLPRLELPAVQELWGDPVPCTVKKLVLPGPTMCVLHDISMLESVEAIYVPRALLQRYRSDTNWAYGADRIFAIEDGGAA